MDNKENNMSEPENNMPVATFHPNLAFASEIILPLGTKYNTGPIENPDVAESKVLIGILGELEKLIFELNDRVSKLENTQAAMMERIEKSLFNIEDRVMNYGYRVNLANREIVI